MKKVLLGVMALAIAFVLAAPAMAEVRLTTTGYMDFKGIMVKKNLMNLPGEELDSSNSYYKQKMVIDPVLHINDKVRIHGRVTIMERFFEGSMGPGSGDDITKTDDRVNYRAKNNNFWWERLYLSFPILGGHLYAGRMSGGSWDTWFQDWDSNRDRIKWVGRLPNSKIVLAALVEKLRESDGGFVGSNYTALTPNPNPATDNNWTESFSDLSAYAVGAVIPIGKHFVYKPLSYNVHFEFLNGWDYLFMNGWAFNMNNFSAVGEFNYRYRKWDDALVDGDLKGNQLSGWLEANLAMGPAKVGLGGFYVEGEDSPDGSAGNKRNTLWGTGGEFQPYFLFFSEDVGALWDTAGVSNGTIGLSGYQSIYGKASYQLSEAIKVTGLVGYLKAAEMELPNVDKELGWEFDVNIEWKLMDNLAYVVDLAYLKAGDYFKTVTKDPVTGESLDLSNNPYGMRHMLVIQW